MDDDNNEKNVYPNFKINGKIFPIWILKNFKNYKLPDIIRKDDIDPCNIKTKLELRKYQEFISRYLDYRSPYHDILIYHGMGSGKTATAIHVYNTLYNATSGWNIFLMIKASLHDDPWEKSLKYWLSKQDYEHRYSNIIWIHYDSPYADTEFMTAVNKTDSSLKNMYIIDEAHNFISNVYSNLSSKKGKRAISIYDHIIQDKKENASTRVILLSGTPAINKPFELAIMFNLLRPGVFPKSEILFNQYYINNSSVPTLNLRTKNIFQRRIIGLVSYYIGGTPDVFATKTLHYVDAVMSEYQTDIYNYFEEIESKIMKKKKHLSSSTESYRTYTRQSSNFVFPMINQIINGENRPRPSKFKIGEKELELLLKTKNAKKIKETRSSESQAYFQMLATFREEFDMYLQKIYDREKNEKININYDIENFKKYKSYENYLENNKERSELLNEMMKCSSKFVNVIFNTIQSPGPVLIYSNYVLIEGLDILKIYLKYFGFGSYNNKNSKDYHRYGEFHANISREMRREFLKVETDPDNKNGKNIKIMMFSPAGSEGISLANIRQVHIIEPYWQEVRIVQMIARAIRICSHKDLPPEDRHVDIYRYRSVKYNIKIMEVQDGQKVKRERVIIEDPLLLKTVDFDIEDLARTKNNLIESFLDSIKEVAIDCELNKAHNMSTSKYRCFQFNEVSLFDKNIGPAYKDDIVDDMKIASGSNSVNTMTIKVKVMRIRGIIDDEIEDTKKKSKTNDEITDYWYNPETGVVYDIDLNYPIGKIKYDLDGIPVKLEKDLYKIELIHIPLLQKS
jgi:hypothetical protein